MTPKTSKLLGDERLAFHEERANFTFNLLKNPNYYGTFPGLGDVINKIHYNTTFEELVCLGLNPGTGFAAEGTLEAILQINLTNGYDSGPCGSGSTEWVRFYVEDGASWTDLGATGVTVYNLSGSNFPVSYAVSVDLPHVKKFCTVENVLNVRAILSWEFEPPPNQPNFVPVWGNAIDARVQIAPEFFFKVPISSLIASGLVKVDPVVEASIDLKETFPAKPQHALSFAELKALYEKTEVPAHRFGFASANKLQAISVERAVSLASANQGLKVAEANLNIGPELSAILAAIEDLNGDTTYEELTCAGYNPETRTLEGVVSIKLNGGYSGGLCTAGSYEYVSFFGFFGGIWNALGTAQVNVHDLNAVQPGNPVNYAVFRLSNLTSEICESLTAVPLRAILSWQTVPTGPDFIPVWGNVLNTFVQPQVATLQGAGAKILRIGEVGVEGIANSTNPDLSGDWLANPTGVAGDCNNADDSPFGGSILIEADLNPKPSGAFDPVTGVVLLGAHPIIYQVFMTPPAGPRFQLINQFGLGVFPTNAPIAHPEVTIQQQAVAPYGPVNNPSGSPLYYTYYESADGQLTNPRAAAWFIAGGLPQGNYTVEIDAFAWDGAMYQPIDPVSWTFYVYNGYDYPNPAAPQVTLGLTSAADCGNIGSGAIITGSYSASDDFFGAVEVAMTQVYIGGVPVAMPTVYLSNANSGPETVAYDGTNTFGTSGTFTIYTGDYDPNKDPTNNQQPNQVPLPTCGYTIQLTAWDRALVNTTCNHHESQEAVGFCLVAAQFG
jgi:hypothetical protein